MQYLILFFSIMNLLLGVIVLIHSSHERENVTFLGFAFFASVWTFNNFYLRLNPEVDTLRTSYGLGLAVATFGLIWAYFFLKKELPYFIKYAIFPLAAVFFFITIFSDKIIARLQTVTRFGYEGELGSWFNLYGILFAFIIIFIISVFLRELKSEKDQTRRNQIEDVLMGALFFSFVSSIVSFIIPTFLHTLRFTILDNFSFSIFIFMIGYAIIKYRLFNIKVIVTELLVFSLWSLILIRTLVSDNVQDLLVNGGLLVLTVVIGIFLIRSVIREVQQREKIEKLAKDLEETNDRQEKLIHFIGHEVKGYLTKGEYAFSELVDGDFGAISSEVKTLSTTALAETRKGVQAVTDILKAANLKRGTVTYEMKPVDLKDLVKEEIIKTKPQADEKGLEFKAEIDEEADCVANLDRSQFGEHVIRNIIDNSIKYTPTGRVTVGLSKNADKLLFYVRDTGVGINDDDRRRLFTEGGRGKDSIKVNVHSTGYGLYIAKGIIDAHGGRVWVESDGPGKGSTFKVELPVISQDKS